MSDTTHSEVWSTPFTPPLKGSELESSNPENFPVKPVDSKLPQTPAHSLDKDGAPESEPDSDPELGGSSQITSDSNLAGSDSESNFGEDGAPQLVSTTDSDDETAEDGSLDAVHKGDNSDIREEKQEQKNNTTTQLASIATDTSPPQTVSISIRQPDEKLATKNEDANQLAIEIARINFVAQLRNIFETGIDNLGNILIQTVADADTEDEEIITETQTPLALNDINKACTYILKTLARLPQKPDDDLRINGYSLINSVAEIIDIAGVDPIPKQAIHKQLSADFANTRNSVASKKPKAGMETRDAFLAALDTQKQLLTSKKFKAEQFIEHLIKQKTLTDKQYQTLNTSLLQAARQDEDPAVLEQQFNSLIEEARLKLLKYLGSLASDKSVLLAINQSIKIINETAKESLDPSFLSLKKKIEGIYSRAIASLQLILPPQRRDELKQEFTSNLNDALLSTLKNDLADQDKFSDGFEPPAPTSLSSRNQEALAVLRTREEKRDTTNSNRFSIKDRLAELHENGIDGISSCNELIAHFQTSLASAHQTYLNGLSQLAVKSGNVAAVRLLLKHGAQPDLETKDNDNNTVAHLVAQPLQACEANNDPTLSYETQVANVLAADADPTHALLEKTNKNGQTPLMVMRETAAHEEAEHKKVRARYDEVRKAFEPVLTHLSSELNSHTTTESSKKLLRQKIAVVLTEMNNFSVSADTSLDKIKKNLSDNSIINKTRHWWSSSSTTAKVIDGLKDKSIKVNVDLTPTAATEFVAAAQAADKSRKQKMAYLQREKRCQELLQPVEDYLNSKISKCSRTSKPEDWSLLQEKLAAVKKAKEALVNKGVFSQEILKAALAQERPYTFWKSIPKSHQLLEKALEAEAEQAQAQAPRCAAAA